MIVPSTQQAEWTVVLRADGVISQVAGAPSEWTQRPFREIANLPVSLREAALALLETPHGRTAFLRRHVRFAYGSVAVDCEVVLLQALPLHWSLVAVDDLLLRTLDTFLLQARSHTVDIQLGEGTAVTLHLLHARAAHHRPLTAS